MREKIGLLCPLSDEAPSSSNGGRAELVRPCREETKEEKEDAGPRGSEGKGNDGWGQARVGDREGRCELARAEKDRSWAGQWELGPKGF